MIEVFRIEWRKTASLKPAEYNPRKELKPGDPEYEQLKKSINEFGLVDPLIINHDSTIIGGRQRWSICTEAGFEEVPCVVLNLPKDKEKELNIALNKISGEWNMPLLRDLLLEIDTGLTDMAVMGFEEIEIEAIMGKAPQIGPKKPTMITCPECGHEFTLGGEKE